MAYSKAIANAIVDFLRDDDWHYEFDENKEIIRINLESLYDLENYGDQLHQALSKYL